MRAALVAGLLLTMPLAAAAQEIRGRVVDEQNRQAVSAAGVTLRSAAGESIATASTDGEGFFTFKLPPAGSYTIVVERMGFAAEERKIDVTTEALMLPAFVLTAQAVQLDELEVEAEARRREVGFSRPSQLMSGSRMAKLESQGARVETAIRELSGVRVRNIRQVTTQDGQRVRNYVCIEATRGMVSMQSQGAACNPVVLVLNGIPSGDPHMGTRSFSLSDIESIEFLPPAEAMSRYGMSAGAVGALVIWTRGSGPHKSAERL